MEGGVGSGGVLKKKSSSGCLIIKKKSGDKNSDGGFANLSDNKEKKIRPRLVSSSSSSSDEDESLEFMRRKINEKRSHKIGSEIKEYEKKKKKKNGIEIGGEKKRSRLDLFEFDEYDEFDENKKNDYSDDRFKEFDVGSKRNLVVDKRKKGCYNGSSSVKSKEFELEDDEAHMPISMLKMKYRDSADEPIRLQGKNGVLKVMVNKKKKMAFRSECKNYDSRTAKEREVSDSDDVVKESLERSHENRGSFVDKEESAKKEKGKLKLEKVNTPSQQACSSKKMVKKDEEQREEGKSKRGCSTEKQMLREKIRGMLIDAGWTIDYRPRRNRDYLDSVYINPSGTAYWSVVKAYDAFKKQLEEDNGKNKSDVGFAPIAEDLISKLTRQTKKKIEREMRRKSKEDGMTMSAPISAESSDGEQNDERLSSYIKQKRKLRKGKSRNVDRESDDELTDDSPKRKKPAKTRVEKPSSYAIKSNVDEESDELIHDSPKMKKPANARVEKSSSYAKSQVIQGRTSKNIGRCTLLVRGKGENSDSDGYVPYSGKRTVLAWLIDSGTAKLSERVQYMNRRRTRVMLEGWITRDGIHCGCCSKILAVSKFELHAGSKLRQAFQNIVLESGLSLLQCQIDAWNKQNEPVHRDFFTVDVDGDDPDDDTCGVCGDGGDLICCDSCPSTFHQICLEIKMLPSDDWHCPNCICKFCWHVNGNGENDSKCDGLNKCSFCEKKYHKSCSERVCAVPISSNGASFCGLKCQEIYDRLQKILGVKNELGGGFSWSLIQRSDVSDTTHHRFSQRVECNSKLAVALSVMDECFLPIVDGRSGINLIHNVVYNCGSNFNRLNYHGFYTAILERGDEIISAASIRIHGACLAEMPFIGTREMYRRQGMCRRLLSAIETELRSLKVEQLIVPAISEHTNTWTTVFGFHELEDVHKREIKSLNMLVFPGTDMLQKQLLKQEISNGVKDSESTENQPGSPVQVGKIDSDSCLELNRQASNGSGPSHETKTNDNTEAIVEAQNAYDPDKTEENEMGHEVDEKVNHPVSCEMNVDNHTESAEKNVDNAETL